MTQVKLLGELGEKYGTDWSCGHNSVRDILKLIDCQVEGFREYLAECHEKGIQFTIQNGDDFIDADLNEMALNNLKDTVIITPIPAGSGKGMKKLIGGLLLIAAFFFVPGLGTSGLTSGAPATTKTLSNVVGHTLYDFGAMPFVVNTTVPTAFGASSQSVAAALSSGATLSTAGNMVLMLGTNLALVGLAEMQLPDAGEMTSDPSFLFNGANNNIEQGQPVPVLYGTMKIGGTPLSQGFKAGELKNTTYNLANASATSQTYFGDGNSTYAVGGTSSGDDGTAAVMIK